ncbi:MAG TPA: DMT family transporter [Thermohalobaculum sp.]|nr:DMT family transporter [Thermohalobaculum sp.]
MNPTAVGALWIIGGTSLIALSDNFVTGLSREMGLWQFHMLRSAMVIPVAFLLAVVTGQARAIWPVAPVQVMQRSLFGMIGLMMYFAALPAVGIAQAAGGFFTAPIWVAVLSALFFGERVGPRRIVGVVIGFGGVCLVLGVGAQPIEPMALVAVAGGVSWAMNVIWVRRYCMNETAICLAVWQFIALFLAGLVGLGLVPWLGSVLEGVPGTEFASLPWQPVVWETMAAVFVIGLAGITSTACMAQGYKMGAASIMGLFDFSFLFWAPLFAWLIWGDTVSLRMAAGMGLIVIAGALALWSGARVVETDNV